VKVPFPSVAMQESTQETSNRSPAFGLQVGEGGLVSGPILVGRRRPIASATAATAMILAASSVSSPVNYALTLALLPGLTDWPSGSGKRTIGNATHSGVWLPATCQPGPGNTSDS